MWNLMPITDTEPKVCLLIIKFIHTNFGVINGKMAFLIPYQELI